MISFWRFFAIKTGNPVVQLKKKFKVLDSRYTLFACVFFSLSQSTKAMRTKEKRNNISSCQTMKKGPKVKTKSLIIYSIVERMHLLFLFYAFFSSSLSDTHIHSHLLSLSLVDCLQEFFVYVHIILWCPYLITCSAHLFSSSLSHSLP